MWGGMIEEFSDRGWRGAAEEARRVVGDGPACLSFDIDSFDPALAPGTGTPEPGGLTVLEAQRLIRALAGLDLVGTALAAATILFESPCALATARAAARQGEAGFDGVRVTFTCGSA
jgi:guanidinopropionase